MHVNIENTLLRRRPVTTDQVFAVASFAFFPPQVWSPSWAGTGLVDGFPGSPEV